jgi:hypothetical protein
MWRRGAHFPGFVAVRVCFRGSSRYAFASGVRRGTRLRGSGYVLRLTPSALKARRWAGVIQTAFPALVPP